MSVSDHDIIWFYQEPLSTLWLADGDYMYAIAGWPQMGAEGQQWYETALAAIARLSLSGLIDLGDDADVALRKLANPSDGNLERIWTYYLLLPTKAGDKLAESFQLPDEPGDTPVPGFREALGRIFDEHGVGFDVELPYRMQF